MLTKAIPYIVIPIGLYAAGRALYIYHLWSEYVQSLQIGDEKFAHGCGMAALWWFTGIAGVCLAIAGLAIILHQ